MRRVLAVAASLCLAAGGASARALPKGTVELSGASNLGFSSLELDVEGRGDVEVDTTALEVDALYYAADDLGVGLTWFYENTEVDSGSGGAEDTVNALGPVVSYNLGLSEAVSLGLSASVGWLSLESRFDRLDTDASGWYLRVGAAGKAFLNPHVSLNAGLSYLTAELEEDRLDADVDVSGWDLSLGLSLYFGQGAAPRGKRR